MTEFAGKFKQLREQKQLSQQEVADMLCVDEQTVSEWENEESTPDIETLLHIAQTFGVKVDDLLTEDEDLQYEEENMSQTHLEIEKPQDENLELDIDKYEESCMTEIVWLIGAILVFLIALGMSIWLLCLKDDKTQGFAIGLLLLSLLIPIIGIPMRISRYKKYKEQLNRKKRLLEERNNKHIE